MDEVTDEILTKIYGAGLELHDLLHAARVCKRWRQLVEGSSDDVWQALASKSFDAALKQDDRTWRDFYKEQHRKRRLVMLQKHRIRVLQAQDRLTTAKRELEDHRRQLRREHERREQLEQALRQAERASLMSRATQVWEPVAVRRFHNDIVEQSQMPSSAHLQQVNSELKLVSVQINRHINGIRGSKVRVKAAKQRLKQLEP